MPRTSRPRASRLGRACLLAAILAFGARSARAQLPILLEGLADAELWSTTRYSNLLTRNAGRAAGLGRVQLLGAVEPLSGLVFYAKGEVESGAARTGGNDRSFEFYRDQFAVRYTRSRAFVADVGKLQPVVGAFAPRHFSNRNPLIGAPDGYSLDYPLGAEVSGETRHFDYRAAMVSLPASHVSYVPAPTPRLRPAIGGGFTPVVGARIGASFTEGSYLNHDFSAGQLHDRPWSAYKQRVIALDARFARGYLETYAEAARGSYEVPGRAGAVLGYTYYGEAKYTLTPRFFVAARAERNKYPFIRLFGTGTTWTARQTDFVDGELGVGYRPWATAVVKVAVRGDRWWVAPGANGFLGRGGRAVAMQVSQAFDVIGAIRSSRY